MTLQNSWPTLRYMKFQKVVKSKVVKVFEYTSKCCGHKANKPACERTDKHQSTLGTWTCSRCGNKCTVNRHKVEENIEN